MLTSATTRAPCTSLPPPLPAIGRFVGAHSCAPALPHRPRAHPQPVSPPVTSSCRKAKAAHGVSAPTKWAPRKRGALWCMPDRLGAHTSVRTGATWCMPCGLVRRHYPQSGADWYMPGRLVQTPCAKCGATWCMPRGLLQRCAPSAARLALPTGLSPRRRVSRPTAIQPRIQSPGTCHAITWRNAAHVRAAAPPIIPERWRNLVCARGLAPPLRITILERWRNLVCARGLAPPARRNGKGAGGLGT